MNMLKKIAIVISVIIIAGLLFVAYVYQTTTEEENIMKGDHKVLLLCADPSEQRPGIGAVDMAFVISTHDGHFVNATPVYPGYMAHPTASPPQYLKETQGVSKQYLHDALWDENVEVGAKLAQEIVEYNTGMKTDIVVIVTPEAIDALLNSIGPIYVEGQGYVTGSSIDFLRNEQEEGMSRGNAVEGLMHEILDASKNKANYSTLLSTSATEYVKGNIVVVPKDAFLKILVANGLQGLL